MSTTYERAPKEVERIAKELIAEHKEHEKLKDYRVKIDFVFAYSSEAFIPALKKNGVKCLGIARKLSLKDRAMDRGDAEISIDGEWWKDASDLERRALLDHELYHLDVNTSGVNVKDDLGRPKLYLRPHDYEFGWFKHIAKRYGMASEERKQAKQMLDDSDQFFWPDIIQRELSLDSSHLKAV
jgi:hypothetical protein